MEHTHLVKGLDYSLLNKVRSEINKSQAEVEAVDELELAYVCNFHLLMTLCYVSPQMLFVLGPERCGCCRKDVRQ